MHSVSRSVKCKDEDESTDNRLNLTAKIAAD